MHVSHFIYHRNWEADCSAWIFQFSGLSSCITSLCLFHSFPLISLSLSPSPFPPPPPPSSLPPLPQTCQLGICFGWIPGTSALSTRTQQLSCGMTWKLSCLEHDKVSSKNINSIANEIHFIFVPERGGTWAIVMHNGLIFGQSFTQVYVFIPWVHKGCNLTLWQKWEVVWGMVLQLKWLSS